MLGISATHAGFRASSRTSCPVPGITFCGVKDSDCPFCRRVEAGDYLQASELAVAFSDIYPLAPGHTLVIPKRHEADFFALTAEEQAGVWDLARDVRAGLEL